MKKNQMAAAGRPPAKPNFAFASRPMAAGMVRAARSGKVTAAGGTANMIRAGGRGGNSPTSPF